MKARGQCAVGELGERSNVKLGTGSGHDTRADGKQFGCELVDTVAKETRDCLRELEYRWSGQPETKPLGRKVRSRAGSFQVPAVLVLLLADRDTRMSG